MKNSFKFTKILVLVLFISMGMFGNYHCYADEIIKEVDCQKEWIIRFNKPIDPNSIYNDNIVVKDANNNIINGIYIILLNNGQAIKVTAPCEGYKYNETYTLILTNNIRSLDGKNLGKLKTKKFKIKKSENQDKNKTPIMGKGDLSPEQMAEYVLIHNPNPKISIDIHELAKIFLEEGDLEGVRGDIAFCQSIKETGFFKYGGQVLPEQNNYAGIGAVNNSPVGKGAWFKDAREGVRAQIQHLKGYATSEMLENTCVDPRYCILKQIGKLGVAPNWEDLNGKWAVPGKNYGQDIIKIYRNIKSNTSKDYQ